MSFFKSIRRRKLTSVPFPEHWRDALLQNVAHYSLFSQLEQEKLHEDIQIFIAEKNWEGCDGLELTDEIQATIAAQACLLTLCIEHDYYPNVRTILIYPAGYIAPTYEPMGRNAWIETSAPLLGHATNREGPVVLSWQDALTGGLNDADGHNLVLHEFAHKLDMLDGDAYGTPRLGSNEAYDQWAQVMSAEFDQLVQDVQAGRATVIDRYGATNAAEFFAVCTESFFEKPRMLRKRHRQLYGVLRDFYRQDPCARVLRAMRAVPRSSQNPSTF
jgi:Mlc titration factor MtfA (ptsG expression regulator)